MTETTNNHTQEILEAYLNLGMVLRKAGEYTEACERLQCVIARDPNSTSAYLLLGLTQLDAKQYSDAEASLQRVVEIAAADDDATLKAAYFSLGSVEQGLGKYGAAIAALKNAIGFGHETADAWDLLGDNYAFDDQMDEALQAFDHAIQIDPQHAEVD